MQTSQQDIYLELSKEKEINEQVYKDIGSFVFRETAKMLKEPISLILKLKGIGSWHLRKKRLDIVVNEWTDRAEVKTREDFPSNMAYAAYLDKHLQYINFKERLEEYERYLSIKKEVREQRYKTQTLLAPTDTTDKFKSD